MNGTRAVSVSKLKSELRQAQRLLSKDRLDAGLKVETQRRIDSLQQQINDEQRIRGLDTSATPSSTTVTKSVLSTAAQAPPIAPEPSKTSTKASKSGAQSDSARVTKYKLLRHVEYQKTKRRLKQAQKTLNDLMKQMQEVPHDDRKASRKALRALEKSKGAAQLQLEQARIDAWYNNTFPPQFKYVALYPGGTYVEFGELPRIPKPAQDDAADQYITNMPSARKSTNDVRDYWRAVVKSKLDSGELTGQPTKSNKKEKAAATKASAQQTSKSLGEHHDLDDEHQSSEASEGPDDFFE